MKLLMGLVQPDFGDMYIFGEKIGDDSFEYLKRIGSIIENPYFYEKMTGRQNLEMHCDYMGYHNYERISGVLDLVDLQDAVGKAVSHYSLGMKQRLAFSDILIIFVLTLAAVGIVFRKKVAEID